MTAADLARAVGVKPSSMSLWLDGTTKSIKGGNLVKAAKALQVNVEWLATGRGPMEITGHIEPHEAREAEPNYLALAAKEHALLSMQDPLLEEVVGLFEEMSGPDRHEALSFLRVFAAKKGAPPPAHSANPPFSRGRKKAA